MKLCVNLDTIAILRNACLPLGLSLPEFALLAESGGAWSISVNMRDEKDGIVDGEITGLTGTIKRLNMAITVTEALVERACCEKPDSVCFVPGKGSEFTSGGGLNVVGSYEEIYRAVNRLHASGVAVACLIDADEKQMEAAQQAGCDCVELCVGAYAKAAGADERGAELERLTAAANLAGYFGLKVTAGCGIDYGNIHDILKIPYLSELNMGRAIFGRAIAIGLESAVREMVEQLRAYNVRKR